MTFKQLKSRRDFLRLGCRAITTLGAASLFGEAGLVSARAQTGTDYKALVCIFLYGGNDGNNLLIPSDTPTYTTYKNIRHEVDASKGRVRPLVRQRSSDLLRRTRKHVADWNVSRRREGRNARGLIERGWAQIIAGPADRIEHRLACREPAIAIWPTVIVRRTVGVLATKVQFIRGIVGGPIASLVSAVHPGKDPPV